VNYKLFSFILICCSFTACRVGYKPVTGDLVFQDLDCGDLCTAIEKVTTGVDGSHLSHVGIVSVENDTTFIYEAIGPGVIKTQFSAFLKRSDDKKGHPKVLVGRLKPEYLSGVPKAIKKCRSLLGKPYDDGFDLLNERYYCSELVYFAFTDTSDKPLFSLNSMTFKDPDTGKTFPAWEEYFKKLEIPVPEGKPGLNPGAISRSSKIDIVFRFYH
jgi:hypothetical protein